MTSPSLFYREIPLTQGQVALVDTEDYAWLTQWKWYAAWCKVAKTYYAQRELTGNGRSGRRTIRMARAICDVGPGVKVDHHNHDTLDNRRENLRVATHRQNVHNSRVRSDSATKLKGVALNKVRGKPFRAHINANGRRMHLGLYNTAVEAAIAYNQAATKYFGEFAYLNDV